MFFNFKERDEIIRRSEKEKTLASKIREIVNKIMPQAKNDLSGLSGEGFRLAFIKRYENDIIKEIYNYKIEGKRLESKIDQLAKREIKDIEGELVVTDGFNQIEVIRGYLYSILDEITSDNPEMPAPTDKEISDFNNDSRGSINEPGDDQSGDLNGIDSGPEYEQALASKQIKDAKRAERDLKTLRSQEIRRGIDPDVMDETGYGLTDREKKK